MIKLQTLAFFNHILSICTASVTGAVVSPKKRDKQFLSSPNSKSTLLFKNYLVETEEHHTQY